MCLVRASSALVWASSELVCSSWALVRPSSVAEGSSFPQILIEFAHFGLNVRPPSPKGEGGDPNRQGRNINEYLNGQVSQPLEMGSRAVEAVIRAAI